MFKGSCLCGAVKFEVDAGLPPPVACHCTKCRKASGHYNVSAEVKNDALTIHGAENLTWYASSEKASRGFCSTCGSQLFFDPPHRDWIGVAIGAFDGPTGTSLGMHIFVADKGDYYDLTDGLPQNLQ